MRRTLLAITAVLLATVGTALLYVYVASADARAQQGIESRKVLVAAVDLPAGTPSGQMRVVSRSMPAFGVVPQALTELGPVQGKVLTVPVLAGEQLSARMFDARSSNGLTPGNRGVSVAIGDANRVASLLKNGDTVAVFRQGQGVLTPVLPRARVLIADPRGIVTFDLSEGDAAALLEASAKGPLVLEIIA